MKPVWWVGDSRKAVLGFSDDARREAGYQLDRVQRGEHPTDWKPLPTIGPGVREIRLHAENAYRVLYVAQFPEAVYVLHAFVKKTQRTPKVDIDLATRRYRDLIAERKGRG